MTARPLILRTLESVIVLAAVVAAAQQAPARAAAGAAARAPLRFDVVSVKPSLPGDPMVGDTPQRGGHWVVRAVPTAWLIFYTFETQPDLVVGLPDWAKRQRYTIEAHMPPSTTDSQLHTMLRSMLRDRFGMVWHTEMHPANVATLALAGPAGPGLHAASGHCLAPGAAIPPNSNEYECGVIHVTPGPTGAEFSGTSVTLGALATFFTRLRLRAVVDETGSKSLYDFDVAVAFPSPYQGQTQEGRNFDFEKAIQTAFKKQLGLDLDMTKTVRRPIPVVVIDRLERASPN